LLHNWRCFRSDTFVLPSESFGIIDSNGSGKSSLLSAVYSLYTGKSWPGVKINENITAGQQYFGVLTDMPDWSFSGQISNSNRLQTNYNKPQSLNDDWPVVFTYTPNDNYWLSEPRNIKLKGLDYLIGKINPKYLELISKLDKYVRAKQKILKSLDRTDMRLVYIITRSIHELSIKIWEIRKKFFDYIESNLIEFEKWVETPLKKWELVHEITDIYGVRRRYKKVEILPIITEKIIEDLWQKEKIIGKVMYGAQRDEFHFKSDNVLAQNTLSRGENRLLILFIKYLTQNKVLEQDVTNRVWWFLDDVYNEFDTTRESIIQKHLLQKVEFYIYTGTKNIKNGIKPYKIKQLRKT
jgi:DNA replication and repair protein RecF